ncbi:MAG: helix-turn-helix transcriptional regulator [Bacteroidetes bacterium]|nr:helix-turn-helix transcriptional regulator [Bacteroidota bacterium]
MLLHQFPDLQWLKQQANNHFADRKGIGGIDLPSTGWPNVVINVQSHSVVRDQIKGPLSLFSNLTGSSNMIVDGRRTQLPPGYFFLTNLHQHYTLEVANKQGPATETFNIHFGEDFSRRALAVLFNPAGDFEDDGKDESTFPNCLIPIDIAFSQKIEAIRSLTHDPQLEEVLLFELLDLLIHHTNKLHAGVARVPLQKASTRKEILRRLLMARDLIYSSPAGSPGLEEMAAAACMSKFHFLRLFKEVFDETPVQFARRCKVEEAKRLLTRTDLPVSRIAVALGFPDSSTFSRTFRQVEGIYPAGYRSNTVY